MAPSFQAGDYHLSPARVVLVCSHCGWREQAEEAHVGLDEERWYTAAPSSGAPPLPPPPAYRCGNCGRLRYLDEAIEIETWELCGFPVEPVKVA